MPHRLALRLLFLRTHPRHTKFRLDFSEGLALLFVPIEQIVRSFVTPLVLAQRGACAAIESLGSAYDRRSWKARAVYR